MGVTKDYQRYDVWHRVQFNLEQNKIKSHILGNHHVTICK